MTRGPDKMDIPPARASGMAIMGARVYPRWIGAEAQAAMVAAIRDVVRAAPLIAPETPGGRKMSVQMTAAGRLGWITDRHGYRYSPTHPDGQAWPPIPAPVLAIWRALSGCAVDPDCCLINFYAPGARMGLHQDRDEGDFGFPVLSISLGDDGLFRIGGRARRDPTRSLWLRSGDVLILEGDSRLARHGIDRIRPGTSPLLAQGGRINLTLRVVR